MATSSPSIIFDNTSTATFRTWGQAVSSALQTVGLIKTTDTGQIDWTTVTLPGGGNTAAGYEIYRLADSLQASKPVFMKIEYGTGSSASYPAIMTTFSTGTNGAGTVNGVLSSSRYVAYGSGTTTSQQCYFASDTSYLTMILGSNAFSSGTGFFAAYVFFDRTRDTAGAINGNGFQWLRSQLQNGPGSYGSAQRFGGNTNNYPSTYDGLPSYQNSGIFSFRINAVGQVGPLTGASNYGSGCIFFQIPATPGNSASYAGDTYYFPQVITDPGFDYALLFLAGFLVDVPAAWSTLVIPVLGANHTYITLPNDFSGVGVQPSQGANNMRTLARFE